MTKLLAVLVAISLAACVDETTAPDDTSTVTANPCAHLCDDDFASYLPPHTCVELACPLSDGTIYRAGGCTP